MPSMAKHLLLLGLALPSGVFGYHLVTSRAANGAGEGIGAQDLVDAVGDFAMGAERGRGQHALSYLDLLDRDLFLVNERYVEPGRVRPQVMFDAALDELERELAPVLFVREPGGRRLQVTVGNHSTTLLLQPIEEVEDVTEQLRVVARVLDEHLPASYDRAEIEYRMINGVLSTLDPHTILMPPDDAKEMDVDNEGEFGGLGIEIALREGRLVITEPMEDTPASRAGLKADDTIVRIEDVSTINMDLSEAVSLLRGPVGSDVTIRVDRRGFDQPQPFTLTRARIPLNRTEGRLLEGDIGYVRIVSFNAHVATDLDEILSRFRRDAAGSQLRGLIIDLRNNPGGYLHQAVEVVDKFVEDGEIVTTVEGGAHPRRETETARMAGTEPDYPIAVLVNGNSASASEIVAGALRNRKRAVIIGERTFGKGSVQHLFRHADESKLKLTVAQYLTPGDKSIQSVGIPPDILLLPSLVESGEEGMVSLYWRDRVDREADLDQHLEWSPSNLEQPVYEVRYLLDREDDDKDPLQSWEVGFARETLLAARGTRRAEVLQSAGDVVKRRQEAEAKEIAGAFTALGIDWADGSRPELIKLDAALDLGTGGVLRSGQTQTLDLVVTNGGTEPVSQLSAAIDSDHPALDGREFYFGRLAPGETRRYQHEVSLPTGFGGQLSKADVVFRDPAGELLRQSLQVETLSLPLPRLSYSIALDDSVGGDGDGLPELGETVALVVTVRNIGEGPTEEAYVRLKNRSGRTVDLVSGRLDVGLPRDAEGAPCAPTEDPKDACHLSLKPGEESTGRLEFELRSEPEGDAWKVELQVGDNSAYDYASVVTGGFRDWFQLVESVQIAPGTALERIDRSPPELVLSRAPELITNLDEAVISGVVHDAQGVEEVMIFHGEDKVFYRGGSSADQDLPFTVDVELDDGPNRITILTRDMEGLVASRTYETWREAPAAQASETFEPGPG